MYLMDNCIGGGLKANNVRNKVADYLLRDAGAVPWQMTKICTLEYTKLKKKSLYEFQLAVFNKLRQYSAKAFFNIF